MGSVQISAERWAPNRFVWHLGFMKTGTTYVQALLWRNRPAIAETTTVFNCRDRNWTLREAALAYCQDPGPVTEEPLRREVRKVIETALESDRSAAILTDENLLGFNLYDASGDVFSKAARLLPILTEETRGFAPEFIFYTREMTGWLRSSYNQGVKQTRETAPFDDWRAAVPFDTDWEVQHHRLQETTDAPVVFRDMTQDMAEGRFLGAFLFERSGLEPYICDRLNKPKGRNESLSPAALEFLRQMNATKIPDRQMMHVRRTVISNPQLFASDETN